jgi:hypothetical protein
VTEKLFTFDREEPVSRPSRYRRLLAEEIAKEMPKEGILGIAVSGSVGRGDATEKSDLSIDIYREGQAKYEIKIRKIAGVVVTFNLIPAHYHRTLIRYGKFSVHTLRALSRVTEGFVLYERDGFLSQLKEEVSTVELGREYVLPLLKGGERDLQRAGERRERGEDIEAVLLTRRAGEKFVILLQSMDRERYQQPKFVFKLLRNSRHTEFLDAYRRVHRLSSIDRATAQEVLEAARDFAAALQKSRGTEKGEYFSRYARAFWEDAEGLYKVSDFEGSVFNSRISSTFSLRSWLHSRGESGWDLEKLPEILQNASLPGGLEEKYLFIHSLTDIDRTLSADALTAGERMRSYLRKIAEEKFDYLEKTTTSSDPPLP